MLVVERLYLLVSALYYLLHVLDLNLAHLYVGILHFLVMVQLAEHILVELLCQSL